MKKILVTGGGGYIGSILVPLLLKKGYGVRLVDRFFFGKDKLELHPNLELVTKDARLISEDDFNNIYGVIDLVAISNDPSGELFQKSTYDINHLSRARTAKIAKKKGVKKYVLPSSCSIYGFQEHGYIADESSKTNPLTTYAKANEMAENDVLKLADDKFCVTVLRQSTVYGYSPRMRFDLAINGMTYGAWNSKKIPLMRDGTQWRPMIHVTDTAKAQLFILESEAKDVNAQIFNIGSDENTYQIKELAEKICDVIPNVQIEWYGDPDIRSYRVSFKKIESLGWKASKNAEFGINEIYSMLESQTLTKSIETITLDWYRHLSSKLPNPDIDQGIFSI